jgi:hypothetical protein
MHMTENINEKVAELEEKRLSAYKKNQVIQNKIKVLQDESDKLYKEEFRLQEEIIKLKTDDTSLYLGKFVKVNDYYMYVTSIANEYNSSICALSGPHFYIRKNGSSEGGYYLNINSGHVSAHCFPPVFVHKLKEIEIITKDDFFAAYDKLMTDGKQHLFDAIELKPIRKEDNEFLYEEERCETKLSEEDF